VPRRCGVGQEHRDLAVLHPPGRAGGLALHAGTGGALLDVAGFVHDQHGSRVAQVLHHIPAHIVTHGIGVPHIAPASRCCSPSGVASPACSAIVQQFLRRSPANNPSISARARRRGSTRANRPAIRPINSSNCSRHRPGSTLSPAATAG
jgi:hypothetical protein